MHAGPVRCHLSQLWPTRALIFSRHTLDAHEKSQANSIPAMMFDSNFHAQLGCGMLEPTVEHVCGGLSTGDVLSGM